MILEAESRDGCVVRVRFEDGTAADVDLSYLLAYSGVFEALRDPEFFRRLRADHAGDRLAAVRRAVPSETNPRAGPVLAFRATRSFRSATCDDSVSRIPVTRVLAARELLETRSP
jgi:hypothetical protein